MKGQVTYLFARIRAAPEEYCRVATLFRLARTHFERKSQETVEHAEHIDTSWRSDCLLLLPVFDAFYPKEAGNHLRNPPFLSSGLIN